MSDRSASAAQPRPASTADGALRCAVVGYDGTDACRAALAWALTHVAPEGRVVAVAVRGLEPAPVPGASAVARAASRIAADDRSVFTAWDEDVRALGDEVELDVRHGRPSEVLLAVAAERDADLIVVGHRSHRAVAPSVLRELLEASDRPVVVVP